MAIPANDNAIIAECPSANMVPFQTARIVFITEKTFRVIRTKSLKPRLSPTLFIVFLLSHVDFPFVYTTIR
jgi:hypothetical protein